MLLSILKYCVAWIETQGRRYPIVVYQLASIIIHRDFTAISGTILFSSLVCNLLWNTTIMMDLGLAETWKVLRFVQKYSLCAFERLSLSMFVGDDVLTRFQNRGAPIIGPLGWLASKVKSLFHIPSSYQRFVNQTKLFYVDTGLSPIRPTPSSFMNPMHVLFGSYLFVTEKPESAGAFQRFYVLHELGHLSFFSKYTWLRGKVGGSPYFLLVLWAFLQLTPGLISFSVLALYSLLILLSRDLFYQRIQSIGFAFDEMAADQFALANLRAKDVREIAEFYERWPVPVDPRMVPEDDAVRRKVLSQNLKEARKKRGKVEGLWAYSDRSATDPHVWLALVLVVALAFFSEMPATPALNPVLIAIIGFILPLTLLFLLVALWSAAASLTRLIDRNLSQVTQSVEKPVQRWPREPRLLRTMRHWFGTEPISCFKCYFLDSKGNVLRDYTLSVADKDAAIAKSKELLSIAERENTGKIHSVQVWNNLLKLADLHQQQQQ